MIKMNQINIDTLNQLIEADIENGILYWKDRPIEFCKNENRRKAFNSRLSGSEALSSIDKGGYKSGMIFRRRFFAHRVIFAIAHNDWPSGQIDHVNGNKRDNRIANLRSVSPSQNARNKPVSALNTSGATGVVWHKKYQKWYATISIPERSTHIGAFDTFEEALAARIEVQSIHGFPNEAFNRSRVTQW